VREPSDELTRETKRVRGELFVAVRQSSAAKLRRLFAGPTPRMLSANTAEATTRTTFPCRRRKRQPPKQKSAGTSRRMTTTRRTQVDWASRSYRTTSSAATTFTTISQLEKKDFKSSIRMCGERHTSYNSINQPINHAADLHRASHKALPG